MTTVYPGSGDPRRSLELLWGVGADAPRRGPKPGLDVGAIVAAAIALADERGLAAASMRAVAERLGRSAMSLYTYVPGRAELLDLMHDTALGELDLTAWRGATWREAVEVSVRDVWALYERHPWMLEISDARASLGPNSMAVFEAGAANLDGVGLTGPEVVRLAGAIQLVVQAGARVVGEARAAARETGQTDDDWWLARVGVFEEVTAAVSWPERFPVLARLQDEGVFEQPDRAPDDDTAYLERDAIDSFELGLRCLLDGIQALIDTRHAGRSPG